MRCGQRACAHARDTPGVPLLIGNLPPGVFHCPEAYTACVIFEMIAIITAGLFSGAAVYINVVEQPARLSCGIEAAVTEWRPSYKRATWMQAPLALVGSLSALLSWWLNRGSAWLIGGLLLLAVVPFTLVVIMPTNKRLENSDLDLSSDEAGRLLRRWGRLHAVRSILSVVAFVVFLLATKIR